MGYTISTAADGSAEYAFTADCTFDELDSRVARREFIKFKMLTDDRWLTKAVLRIYENQTHEEQSEQATLNNNGVGFRGCDAKRGAKLGEAAKVAMEKYNGRMSIKQCAWARQFMLVYAGQLERIAWESEGRKLGAIDDRTPADGLDHDHA